MTIDPPPAQFSAAAAPTDESPALVARRDAFRINGLEFDYGCNPIEGEVHWDPVRSLFNGTMLLLAMTLGPMYFSWPAVAVFLVLCFFTLDTVEKLENCGALCFRYWNKISKTTAKFARLDLHAHQDREKRRVATPSARIFKTFSIGRKFLGQRQIGSFSTVSLCCGHSVGFHRRMIHHSFKCPKWLCADTSARRCCSDQAARP